MEVDLRDYQQRIVEQVISGFTGEGTDELNSMMIESPCGSGKSIMGLAIARFFEEEFGWRTNWVANRRNLLSQILRMNSKFFGLKKLSAVSMFDSNPPAADFLIIDEGHHSATASAAHIDSVVRPKKYLALSATPYRTDKLKLPFQKVVKDAGIHRLIQGGWLSKFHHWVIEKYTPETVAHTYLESPDKWGKTVVFFHSLDQCRRFQAIVSGVGPSCEVVSSQQPVSDREDILSRFESGETKVLANVAILTEGFDCEDINTVFVRDSVKIVTVQMAGRGLRIHDGKTHCNIVQSKNAHWSFLKSASADRSFVKVDDDWLSLSGSNEIIEKVMKQNVDSMIDSEVTIPKFIVKYSERKKRRPNIIRERF